MRRFMASADDKNASHRLGSRREKVPAAVPVLRLLDVYQAHVGFVYQGSRLQGLPGLFMAEPLSRQLTQFVVNERQQFVGRRWVALLNLIKNSCHFGHAS